MLLPSSRVGKNPDNQVSVRGFTSQCGRVHFSRSYNERSVDKRIMLTASISLSLSSLLPDRQRNLFVTKENNVQKDDEVFKIGK